MNFEQMLAQLSEALEKEHRISYRALKRRFDLEDDLEFFAQRPEEGE